MRPKHIIVEKFEDKKKVLLMNEYFLTRAKTEDKKVIALAQIEETKRQMQMLLDRYPQHFI